MSYDRCYQDVDRIYKIKTGLVRQGNEEDYNQISGAVAPGFKSEAPGVLEATRYTDIFNSEVFIIDDEGGNVVSEHIIADSCLFRIFDRPFLAGDPEKALKSWNGEVAVSRSFAEKLGGVNESIGKRIANRQHPDMKLTVCGVYEDYPKNGSIHAEVIMSIDAIGSRSLSNWVGNDRYVGYVKLAEGVDPESLKDTIHGMRKAHQPLEEMQESGTRLEA